MNIASKNQIFLFSILEILIEDMKYNVKNIYFVRNTLSFQLDDDILYFIKINEDNTVSYEERLLNKENNTSTELKKLTFDNQELYLNVVSEIISDKLSSDIILKPLNVQFKLCKLLMWFDISITLEDEILIITNIKTQKQLIMYQEDPNIYKIQIGKNISDENHEDNIKYETLFEYIEEINSMSKFYDKDKRQQLLNIASNLFDKNI